MAETAPQTGSLKPSVTEQQIAGLASCLGEPEPLTALRRISLQVYERTPLPDRVRHLWRYSDPAALLPTSAPLPLGPHRPAVLPAPPAGGAVALLPPGAPVLVASSEAAAAAGLVLTPLVEGGRELMRLGRLVGPEHGLLEALNLACWSSGLLLYVPRDVVVPGAVRVVVPAAPEGCSTRLLVVLDQGAELVLVEEHRGGGPASRQCSVSELFVGDGARLRHALLQDWAAGTSGHLTTRAELNRDADYLGIAASLGGAHAKLDVGAALAGPGAHSELIGVVLGQGRQLHDLHTVHDHRAPHTSSNIDFKVAVSGRARSAYTGLIRVGEGAAGSEAYQENRNLLLSGRAHADTIPELEILTDDVTCTHGATVAPVEEEQLFYLQSRGVARPLALRMVVQGFFGAAVGRLPAALGDLIDPHVDTRLREVLGKDA